MPSHFPQPTDSEEDLKASMIMCGSRKNVQGYDSISFGSYIISFCWYLSFVTYILQLIMVINNGLIHMSQFRLMFVSVWVCVCVWIYIQPCVEVCLPSQSVSEKHNQEKKAHKPLRTAHRKNVSAMFENHRILLFWHKQTFHMFSLCDLSFTVLLTWSCCPTVDVQRIIQ